VQREYLQLLFVVQAFVFHKQKIVDLKLPEKTILIYNIKEAKHKLRGVRLSYEICETAQAAFCSCASFKLPNALSGNGL
jgi:hypothetical protein